MFLICLNSLFVNRCAFANTPKFKEVQGKGKIVTKHWINDCYQERKRLPWRRFALDTNDQGKPESEDEILEQVENMSGDESPETPSSPPRIDDAGSDTEDEVERILAKQKEKVQQTSKEKKEVDPFDADTDEEKLERSSKPISTKLPKIFDKDMFYVDDIFDNKIKKELEKLITIING